jgi:hypothetical protein
MRRTSNFCALPFQFSCCVTPKPSPHSSTVDRRDILPRMAAKKITLNELGEMLAHIVKHMATKDDIARLDSRPAVRRVGSLRDAAVNQPPAPDRPTPGRS